MPEQRPDDLWAGAHDGVAAAGGMADARAGHGADASLSGPLPLGPPRPRPRCSETVSVPYPIVARPSRRGTSPAPTNRRHTPTPASPSPESLRPRDVEGLARRNGCVLVFRIAEQRGGVGLAPLGDAGQLGYGGGHAERDLKISGPAGAESQGLGGDLKIGDRNGGRARASGIRGRRVGGSREVRFGGWRCPAPPGWKRSSERFEFRGTNRATSGAASRIGRLTQQVRPAACGRARRRSRGRSGDGPYPRRRPAAQKRHRS